MVSLPRHNWGLLIAVVASFLTTDTSTSLENVLKTSSTSIVLKTGFSASDTTRHAVGSNDDLLSFISSSLTQICFMKSAKVCRRLVLKLPNV